MSEISRKVSNIFSIYYSVTDQLIHKGDFFNCFHNINTKNTPFKCVESHKFQTTVTKDVNEELNNPICDNGCRSII